MRPVQEWILLILLFLLNWTYCGCYGCLKEEKDALLQIKAWIDPQNSSDFLSSWVDNNENADCCMWWLVECNTTTTRVIKLSLGGIRDRKLGDLYLNTTLFLNFKELTHLDLELNQLVCCLQGTRALTLEYLEVLKLYGNHLNDSILPLLRGAPSLRSLNMGENSLTGLVHINGKFLNLGSTSNDGSILLKSAGGLPFLFFNINSLVTEFHNLTSLEELLLDDTNLPRSFLLNIGALSSLKILSLNRCNLNGTLPDVEFYNLTNLEELFLDYTYIPRSLLLNMQALWSLKILSLNQCKLSGTLPNVGWCELRNLEQLYLSGNELVGVLPPCMRNLSSLLLMDLSSNQFTGNIASSPLVDLMSLEYLSFSSNQFRVPTSFASFSNHSKLKLISCDHNELITEPNLQISSASVFQLNFLSMSNCTSETGKPDYPYFLYLQHDLRVLDLSDNNFGGQFPYWLVQNNTRLKQLYLKNNGLVRGPLQLNYTVSNLSTIDLSSNYMDGQMLKTMCSIFPNLVGLMIADNRLTGGIPRCFENMSYLAYLDMSNNKLSSGFFEFFPSIGSSLWFLKLSNNNFEEQISPTLFNQTKLLYIFLDNNTFFGHIPNSLSRQFSPALLDLGNNHFSGMLPRWLGNVSSLDAIDFSKNHFKGSIPDEIFNLDWLEFLDLSENNLSGSLASFTNLQGISHVHLSQNKFSGPLRYAFYNCSNLVTLDLRENKLAGRIPNWINSLSKLSVLLLKGNTFDGDLPVELCLLTQLSILDLSQNMLSGRLPSCLSNINSTTFSKEQQIEFLSIGGQQLPLEGQFLVYRTMWPVIRVEEAIEFTTKRTYYSYKDSILNYMSGVDLSCNRFTGEIPPEIGNIQGLRALNLSHNNLTGAIPSTFSKLEQIESLDLSHNGLSGEIPHQLTQLNFLAVFSVADNKLSGKTPEMIGQFGTFDQTSYEGNPLLCGPPLQKNCIGKAQIPLGPDDSNDSREGEAFMDMGAFCISFGLAYTTVVVTIATVLCINPYWRRLWFYFIEMFITTCYYFLVDSVHKLCQVLYGRSGS
ncbi:hypothetical protein Tsubulata_018283 [Turnera subulata]|uniref:Leucine-rich repeat-containing N-terminal plant-type domain-containing protein n=1 Tax=Turnera subulata TaxID=218843 RepID=A0A9Q0G894_9ROSI|nr:hypothetical protein Tsubulata_018283 [Turnera subulata]